MKHKARKLFVLGLEQVTVLELSLPWAALGLPFQTQFTDSVATYCLRRERPWSFLMSTRRGHSEAFSSARLPCPRPHWPFSVDSCDNRGPLFSLWDPLRRVGLLPFWKELVTVLHPAYPTVTGPTVLEKGSPYDRIPDYTLGFFPSWSFLVYTLNSRPTYLHLHYDIIFAEMAAGLVPELVCHLCRKACSVGLSASLKEQFSLLNVGFVKADKNSFVDWV